MVFCDELLSENDFEVVLAFFCCYDYGANVSEAVQKIATDQKDNHKNISITAWKQVGYLDNSGVAKKAAEVAQKKEQQLAQGKFYPKCKLNNLNGV